MCIEKKKEDMDIHIGTVECMMHNQNHRIVQITEYADSTSFQT